MEDDASGKLTNLLDSLPQSVNKLATIEEISVVLCAVTPASLRSIVPNLSFNTVFECLASCSRYVIRRVIVTFGKSLHILYGQSIAVLLVGCGMDILPVCVLLYGHCKGRSKKRRDT